MVRPHLLTSFVFHLLTVVLLLVLQPPVTADEKTATNLVRILDEVAWNPVAEQTFVITHGLGGLSENDRFAELARAIAAQCPASNVVRLDWSATAKIKVYGFPASWQVAARIDEVAAEVAAQLRERNIATDKVTLIGESFGNYVNFRMARSLGGVRHLLAFNPANEAGGYRPPDLQSCSQMSWSFHTYSLYDTAAELAHHELFLETPAGSSFSAQHTYGIVWLTSRIHDGDQSWLLLNRKLPARKKDAYCGVATLTGNLLEEAVDRRRPEPSPPAPDEPAREASQALVAR